MVIDPRSFGKSSIAQFFLLAKKGQVNEYSPFFSILIDFFPWNYLLYLRIGNMMM